MRRLYRYITVLLIAALVALLVTTAIFAAHEFLMSDTAQSTKDTAVLIAAIYLAIGLIALVAGMSLYIHELRENRRTTREALELFAKNHREAD